VVAIGRSKDLRTLQKVSRPETPGREWKTDRLTLDTALREKKQLAYSVTVRENREGQSPVCGKTRPET